MRRRTFTTAASIGAAAAAAAVAAGTLPAWAGDDNDRNKKDTYAWKNAVVNGGGFVPGIVFNETEPNLIYARTDIGGCYRWQEDTGTWTPLLDWVGRDKWGWSGVVSMATDPVETNRVYAAVGTYTIDWDPNNGAVLYSDDKGQTWGAAELPFKQGGNMPGRGMGERLVVNPADNAELYLGTPIGNGLWRSRDYGRTWAAVENFPNPGNFVVDPSNPTLADNQGVIWIDFDQIGDKIYVGVADPDDPLYVSEDGGETWQAVPGAAEALGNADGNRTIPTQSAVDNNNGYLYIVICHDPGPYKHVGHRRYDLGHRGTHALGHPGRAHRRERGRRAHRPADRAVHRRRAGRWRRGDRGSRPRRPRRDARLGRRRRRRVRPHRPRPGRADDRHRLVDGHQRRLRAGRP
jgi:hypothetical protein